MTEPTSKGEYEQRVAKNVEYYGFGLDTGMHMPCPFCGAPRFMSYLIIDCQKTMEQEHVCSDCGRGAKTVFMRSPDGLSTRMEQVQTRGPDPSPWVMPMRRL